MNGKGKYRIMVFCLVIFCVTASAFAAADEAKDPETMKIVNRTIQINEREGAFPQALVAQPGTTVIWINNSRSTLEVLFLDKKVTISCGSPVNFFVGKDGAYESGKIPFGGTASLCFLEKGSYEYMVRVNRTWYKPAFGGLAKDHRGSVVIK